MPLAPGTRLGPYEVTGSLGAGGMGEVYKARDTRLDRSVAIKVLPPEFSADPDRRARFEREAKTVAGLNHPHICTLHDVGEHDGSTYLVMEHLQGQTLADRLTTGPLPLDQALTVATEIADALAAAHRQGVVHRDVKPGNVMLTKTGAKLLDFGLAKLRPPGVSLGSVTTSAVPTQEPTTGAGLILGTLQYMAPEQLEGKDTDARSDIFSFGAVLYEMLAGRRAFEGHNQASVIAAILERDPPPVSTAQGATQPTLERLVRKCLEKNRDARWQTAADVADELRWLGVGFATSSMAEPRAARGRCNKVSEDGYQLGTDVCRRIEREELDPQMIGDQLRCIDNGVHSEVLVVCLHGFGGDHRTFQRILETSPYRGVAVTLYGFEPAASRRAVLSLRSHCVILRAFLAHLKETGSHQFTILVGFSSGADLGFRLLGEWPREEPLSVDAYLSVGCNLNLDTCFVSRMFAGEASEGARKILQNLRTSGAKATTLAEWLNIHEYLVQILRKFQPDLRPLYRHGKDIVSPFQEGGGPFPGWFRAATERLCVLRCVFADTEMESTPVKRLLLVNLDSGLLGDRYREDSIQIEPGADHFDLLSTDRLDRHLAELVQQARERLP